MKKLLIAIISIMFITTSAYADQSDDLVQVYLGDSFHDFAIKCNDDYQYYTECVVLSKAAFVDGLNKLINIDKMIVGKDKAYNNAVNNKILDLAITDMCTSFNSYTKAHYEAGYTVDELVNKLTNLFSIIEKTTSLNVEKTIKRCGG